MDDIRDEIFRAIRNRFVTAVIIADDAGVIAGMDAARKKASELRLTMEYLAEEGISVNPGDEITRFSGNPKQIAIAEDLLMGCIAKSSGIASSARNCINMAGEKIKIVCGPWKKMPIEIKEIIRKAIITGGADLRIASEPFIYLDKNYVKILGGIKKSLEAVSDFKDHKKVIQIKGIQNNIALEAVEAAQYNANIIYIDSGNPEDIKTVSKVLSKEGLREKVQIAFGGNVKIKDINILKAMDLDILEIGKEIIDAPLLDLKMEVIEIR